MKQASFDVTTGTVLPPCARGLDFSDGTGADCVNTKAHGEDGCIWSKSAWNERHGIKPPAFDHDGCNDYDGCGAPDCPESAEEAGVGR